MLQLLCPSAGLSFQRIVENKWLWDSHFVILVHQRAAALRRQRFLAILHIHKSDKRGLSQSWLPDWDATCEARHEQGTNVFIHMLSTYIYLLIELLLDYSIVSSFNLETEFIKEYSRKSEESKEQLAKGGGKFYSILRFI